MKPPLQEASSHKRTLFTQRFETHDLRLRRLIVGLLPVGLVLFTSASALANARPSANTALADTYIATHAGIARILWGGLLRTE